MDELMHRQMRDGRGFIAALDQSGGSTPKALRLYGIPETDYTGEAEMFDRMHAMRTRLITSPVFDGSRVIGAILFDMTMERTVEGLGTAEYLWQVKRIVPFLKVDNGLAEQADDVQLMKPIPELDDRLQRATGHGVFGTKMRSVIGLANEQGITAVVDQQFDIGEQIIAAGLIPIIEPEVDIGSPEKQAAEELLHGQLLRRLADLRDDQQVMLKLTIPTVANAYADLIAHPRVLRVVALSGGYSREQANALLAENHGLIASFSRALTEGLSVHQTAAEFDATLNETIETIYRASVT